MTRQLPFPGSPLSLLHYLLVVRVKKAQELFKNPDASITEIAFNLGFASSRHFSVQFKRFTSLTASRYRRSNSKG